MDGNQLIFLNRKPDILFSQSLHLQWSENDKYAFHFLNKLIKFTLRTVLNSIIPDKYSSQSDPNSNASSVLYIGPLGSTKDPIIIRSASWSQIHSRIFYWVGPLKNPTGTSRPESWNQIHSRITSWEGPLNYSTGTSWLSKQSVFLWSNKLSWE